MPIAIVEIGQDLILTNPESRRNAYLHNPGLRDLLESLETFADIADDITVDHSNVHVGIYSYDDWIGEHVLTFYPERGKPNGWIARRIGKSYRHYVEVREDGGGTVVMIRDDLERWTATDMPTPGTFFEELQALSTVDIPNVEWSSDDPDSKTIVAYVDCEAEREIEIVLYPDAWGKTMWHFVTG